MSKYDIGTTYYQPDPLTNMFTPGETVLWRGKPKKSAFILNKVIVMMPFALIWLVFDAFIIISIFNGFSMAGTGMGYEYGGNMKWFLIPFFALHLLPVWIWIANTMTANRRWKNTEYAATDKRIIIKSGFIGQECLTLYYNNITNVRLHIGVIDRMLKVGDLHFSVAGYEGYSRNAKSPQHAFLDISNAIELYPKLQKIVMDIQADTHYPNALRPEENPGYNTKYTGNPF